MSNPEDRIDCEQCGATIEGYETYIHNTSGMHVCEDCLDQLELEDDNG